MFGALTGSNEPIALVRPSAAKALLYRRLRAHQYAHFGVSRRAEQPALRERDGSTIFIY